MDKYLLKGVGLGILVVALFWIMTPIFVAVVMTGHVLVGFVCYILITKRAFGKQKVVPGRRSDGVLRWRGLNHAIMTGYFMVPALLRVYK